MRKLKVTYSLFRTCAKRSPEIASNNTISNVVFDHYLIKDKIELNNLSQTLLTAQQSQFYGHKELSLAIGRVNDLLSQIKLS